MRVFVVFLQALLFVSPLASAFELYPMVSFFSEKGAESERFFQVNNTTGNPLPIEITVKKRAVSGLDSEQLSDSDDFFIFPPQALIPPGETQLVKVKYIGEAVPASASYRVIFSQLPIKDDSNKSSVNMLFEIGSLVFVSPDKVEQSLSVAVENSEDKTNAIVLENIGNGVVVLPQLAYSVKTSDKSYKWGWEDVKEGVTKQYLAPGQTERIDVSSLLSAKDKNVSVEVKGYW